MQDFSYTLLKGNSRVFNSILSLLKHPLKKMVPLNSNLTATNFTNLLIYFLFIAKEPIFHDAKMKSMVKTELVLILLQP